MLRLASRGSALALRQAAQVREQLARHGSTDVEIDTVSTIGDRVTDVPLAMIGDRGLFTREIDAAVLDGRADFAVHSLKDVPTTLPHGLTLAAVTEREDARDAFVARRGRVRLADMPAGARIGTSSLRRRALVLSGNSELSVVDARGNIDSRLRRLDDGHWDAIVVAMAGLRRLGLDDRVSEVLDRPQWLPAPGQGALAVVARSDDRHVLEALAALDHAATRAATEAERTVLARLEGGCQIPIGVLGTVDGPTLTLSGFVGSLDGLVTVRCDTTGHAAEPAAVGEQLAQQLLRAGAADVLTVVRAAYALATPPAGS